MMMSRDDGGNGLFGPFSSQSSKLVLIGASHRYYITQLNSTRVYLTAVAESLKDIQLSKQTIKTNRIDIVNTTRGYFITRCAI